MNRGVHNVGIHDVDNGPHVEDSSRRVLDSNHHEEGNSHHGEDNGHHGEDNGRLDNTDCPDRNQMYAFYEQNRISLVDGNTEI